MSPPWGGPNYVRKGTYDVSAPFQGLPTGLQGLIAAAKTGLRTHTASWGGAVKRGTIAIFLPKNSSRLLIEAAIPPCAHHEVEYNYVGPRCKGLTLYIWF